MGVVMVELIPLGFGGCQKHDAAIMSPLISSLRTRAFSRASGVPSHSRQPGTL